MTVDLLQPKPKFVPRPPESPEVIEARWHKKKAHLQGLANSIKRVRANYARSLSSENEKEFLSALVVAIMDKTAERVGNKKSSENGHFGVTCFKFSHVDVKGDKVFLNYVGKTGVPHEKDFANARIAKAIKRAVKNSPMEVKGEKNDFIFVTTKGIKINEGHVNSYLEKFGITSKDIRGYLANKFTVTALNRIEPDETEKKRKTQLNKILRQVAEKVGHKAPTLKKHYLIPEVWDEWIQKGRVVDITDLGYAEKGGEVGELEEEEELVEEETVEINARFNKVNCDYQIFEITSDKKSDVARIVVRPQEHYDQKDFKDKIFTLDEFKKYYSKGREFTYYYDWNGFNFPDYAVKKFLEGKFDPLSPEEKWLIDNIKSKVDISKPYYIVGYSGDDKPTVNHERAHALYYMSPEYKKSADAIINSIPKEELKVLNKFLDDRNYHSSVYKDEMQAYLMADKDYLMKHDGWSDFYEPYHKKLRDEFNKYFNNVGSDELSKGGKAIVVKSFREYYAEEGWLIF